MQNPTPSDATALGPRVGLSPILFGLALLSSPILAAQAPRFAEMHRMLPRGATYTTAVSLADADGDGDLDAFIGNTWAGVGWNQNTLLLNDGLGHFSDVTSAHLPPGAERTLAIALADLDGDGDVDIYVGNGEMEQDALYLNDGTGHYADATATNLPVDSAVVEALALGDVDGDGDFDALLGIGYGGQDRLYVNDGSGHFTDATGTHFPADSDDTHAVTLGDVDGDGDLDAWAGNFGQDRLYLNDGTGNFGDVTGTNLPGDDDSTAALLLADVDGDGDLDALTGNIGQVGPFCSRTPEQNHRLYLNDGAGVFSDATPTHVPADVEGGTTALALGDLDGDGDLDALLGNQFPGAACQASTPEQNSLLLNDGAGHFRDVTATDELNGTAFALGDVDGDGARDLLASSASNRLLLSDGRGRFSDVTSTHLPAGGAAGLPALKDLDGDDDLDVLLGRTGQDGLYLNDGSGHFVDATVTSLPVDADEIVALALEDVDGDGDPDALLGIGLYGAGGDAQDRLYLNDGTGHFTDATSTSLPVDSDVTSAAALADMDGDGDRDAMLAIRYGSEQARLYSNDGAGHFTDVTSGQLPTGADQGSALGVADFDMDGHADILLATDSELALYLNDGAGQFSDVSSTHLTSLGYVGTILLEDVDADGDCDALLGPYLRYYANDGTGHFSDLTDATIETADFVSRRPLALDDLDGDRDRDLLVASDGVAIVYSNIAHELAWRATPRTGKALVFDLYGAPGERWTLALARAQASRAGGHLGQLLGPSGMFPVLASGVVGGDGQATARFHIPSDAALVGTSMLWHARFGALDAPPITGSCRRRCSHESATLEDL